MNVEVTPEAEADLLEAVSGLRSAAAAEAVVDAFEKTLLTLREFPEVGQARGGRRWLRLGPNWILIYRVRGSTVAILRIRPAGVARW